MIDPDTRAQRCDNVMAGPRLKRRQFAASAVSIASMGAQPFVWCARAQVAPALLHLPMSDGVQIAVEREGAGPAILLVHGASGSHLSFARVTPLLTARFTVFALDRRGYGHSGGQAPHEVAREALDIATIVAALPQPVAIFAHSSGAIETLEALRLTDKVRRVILYEPPLTAVGASDPGPVCAMVAAGRKEDALATFYREYVRVPPAALEAIRRGPAWAAEVGATPALCNELTALSHYHFDPSRFASVRTPTLFLLGDRSPPFMVASVRAGVAAVGGARLQMLPGQQHGALMQAPDMIASIVQDDLGRL